MPQIYIDCGEGNSFCRIHLTAANLDIFREAAELDQVRGKTGTELVDALLETIGDKISMVLRRDKFDNTSDGPNGEPAIQKFKDGKLVEIQHFQHDQLNDTADGTPAFQEFNSDGSLISTVRYTDHMRNNGKNGEPAMQKFDGNGNLIRQEYRQFEKLADGPNGEPAVQVFDSKGTLIKAERHKVGVYDGKEMNQQEITAYVASLKTDTKTAAAVQATPAMKFKM